jgi:hypothetical protein
VPPEARTTKKHPLIVAESKIEKDTDELVARSVFVPLLPAVPKLGVPRGVAMLAGASFQPFAGLPLAVVMFAAVFVRATAV